jgi:hypothetical protein
MSARPLLRCGSPKKKPAIAGVLGLAERVGFEPTLLHNSKPDFESGAIDHSATSPDSGPRGQREGQDCRAVRSGIDVQ